jgi:single-strand DNA-binding protein
VSILNENLAKVAEQYLKKGSKVYIEGQLETRKWTDKQGVEKYTTEIVLRPYKGELTLLDGRGDTGGDTTTQNTQGASSGHSGGAGGRYGGPRADMDDEIPFAPQFL